MERQSEFRSAIESIKQNMIEQLELMNIKAKLCREYYQALIDEGFDKAEALQICQNFKMSEN